MNVSSGWGAFSDGVTGPVASAQTLPKSVKVNAMCPGWVHTRKGGISANRSPEDGADTAIWLATLPDNGPTDGFYRDRERIAR